MAFNQSIQENNLTLRGSLFGFGSIPGYRELPKTLKISLLRTTMIWNSLLPAGPEGEGLRAAISKYLDLLKEDMDAYSERDVVYFIATRTRVRIAKKPRYAIWSKNLVVPIQIGLEKKLRNIIIPHNFLSAHGLGSRPRIENTELKITLRGSEGVSLTVPIHTILLELGINLGIDSVITYVGKTENPGERVIDGNHRGLSDTLTASLEKQDDVFLFSNTFHARHHAATADGGMSFVISNSMTDEIQVAPEADLIEKLLICHFDPFTMKSQRKSDLTKLANSLAKIQKENQVVAVEMELEVDDESDYYRFGNKSIQPSGRHAFRCSLHEDGKLNYSTLQ